MTFVLPRLGGSGRLRPTAPGAVACLALTLATLLPLARQPREDSFPFSTYPMFAQPRSDVRVLTVQYSTPDGLSHPTPTQYLGTGEVLQAARLIRAAWRAGKPEARRLLEKASNRLNAAGIAHEELRLVEVVYEPVVYFSRNGSAPKEQRTLLTWSHARGASAEEVPVP